MSRIIAAAAIAAGFAARYPSHSGTLESLEAGAAKGKLPSVEAGAVKGFSAVSGKLQWVRAKEHFYVSGEIVQSGDFVQVQERDARTLINSHQAEEATQEAVDAAAQKSSK